MDRPTVYLSIDAGEVQLIHQLPRRPPPGKTGGCGRGAQGHAMKWGYRRVRQPLVIPRHPEEERGPVLMCRLQETE
jgi:hypothetical protein